MPYLGHGRRRQHQVLLIGRVPFCPPDGVHHKAPVCHRRGVRAAEPQRGDGAEVLLAARQLWGAAGAVGVDEHLAGKGGRRTGAII
jgi:hypothetical protein